MKPAWFTVVSFSVTAVFVAVITWWKMPNWWIWVVREKSPMTWYEFSLLVLCALCLFLAGYWEKEARTQKLLYLLGFAFTYLATDEILAIHEYIRHKILAPRGIYPNEGYGDIVLLIMMVAGLAVLPSIIRCFKNHKNIYWFFMVGVGLSVLAVVCDSVHIESWRATQHYWEELLETGAMLCFLNAFYLKMIHQKELFKR
jgi:hypothetical protein